MFSKFLKKYCSSPKQIGWNSFREYLLYGGKYIKKTKDREGQGTSGEVHVGKT